MRKITFLILVMILGMSSVSFGKSYLCIPTQWNMFLDLHKDYVTKENKIPKDRKYLVIAANLDPMFNRLCEAMGKPELSSDPKFDTHMSRGENAEELDALIGEWTKNMTARELDEHLDSHGVVTGPIYTIADIATWPWIARHEWHDVGLKNFKNLTRWYLEIAERDAVIKGFDFMKRGEEIPKP